MKWFVFGKTSINLDSLSEMKKSEFEKKYKNHFDVKLAWKELQKVKGSKKKSK